VVLSLSGLSRGVCVLWLLACSPKSASPSFASPQAAADEGLITLRQLADADDYARLGFSSPQQAASATLGPYFTIRVVTTESIRRFPEESSSSAPKDLGQELHLVEAGGKARVCLFVERRDHEWRPVRYGGVPVALRLEEEFNKLYPDDSKRPVKGSLLSIPAFGLYALEDEQRSGTRVVPLRPFETVESGQPISLDELFKKLKPLAEKAKGTFPD
jgi:hypothetical protein